MDTETTIQNSLSDACDAILPPIPTHCGAGGGEQLLIAAIIGFTGDRLSGTPAIAAGKSSLQAVRQQLGASDEQTADSLGELCNPVAGKVKRSLADLGEVVAITPPMVVRGVTIEVCTTGDVCRVECVRNSEQESIVAWLDYEASPDLEFIESAEQSAQDGEVLLF